MHTLKTKQPTTDKLRQVPYLLDQTPPSITYRYRIVTAPPAVMEEAVTALEY